MKNTWRLADGSCTGVLYCGTYKRHGRTSCTPHALPQEVLEKVVLQDLNHLIAQIDNLREWVYGRCFPPGEGHAEAGRKHGIRTEYHRIRRLKQAVYEDYREGLVTKEEYGAYLADYRKRETVLQQQLYAAEQEGSPVEGTESPWLRQLLESGPYQAAGPGDCNRDDRRDPGLRGETDPDLLQFSGLYFLTYRIKLYNYTKTSEELGKIFTCRNLTAVLHCKTRQRRLKYGRYFRRLLFFHGKTV